MTTLDRNTALQRVEAAYRQLLAEVDAWFRQGRQQLGDRVHCRAGCAECCSGLFDISLLDGWMLARQRHRLPADVLAAAQGDVQQVLAALGQRQRKIPVFGPDCPSVGWPDGDELRCPLLDSQGRCRLYDARPLVCRLHGLPQVDLDGTVVMGESCRIQAEMPASGWRGPFRRWLAEEALLVKRFNQLMAGRSTLELETFIAAALVLDFDRLHEV